MPKGIYKRKKETKPRNRNYFGEANPFFGKHHTEKTRIEHGKFIEELWKTPEYREKIVKAEKGKHYSPETEFKKGFIPKNLIKKGEHRGKDTEFTREKVLGEKNSNWKGGITSLKKIIRTSKEYKLWVKNVFERDNFTCLGCGKQGGDLESHHKKSFSKILKENNIKTFEEALACKILWNIQNGMTLCPQCHAQIDKFRRLNYKKNLNNLLTYS